MIREKWIKDTTGVVVSRLDSITDIWTVNYTTPEFIASHPGATIILTQPIMNTGVSPASGSNIPWAVTTDQLAGEVQARNKASVGSGVIAPQSEYPEMISIPLDAYIKTTQAPPVPLYLALCAVYKDQLGDAWIVTMTWSLGTSIMVNANGPDRFTN